MVVKKAMRGSVTVEAAFVIPVIFTFFGMAIILLFYYHDKTLLLSAVQETVAYGSYEEVESENRIKEHFETLVKGRTLLFDEIGLDIEMSKRNVSVLCTAKRDMLSLQVESHMVRTHPEDYIRMFRKLEKIGEEVKEQYEELHEK